MRVDRVRDLLVRVPDNLGAQLPDHALLVQEPSRRSAAARERETASRTRRLLRAGSHSRRAQFLGYAAPVGGAVGGRDDALPGRAEPGAGRERHRGRCAAEPVPVAGHVERVTDDVHGRGNTSPMSLARPTRLRSCQDAARPACSLVEAGRAAAPFLVDRYRRAFWPELVSGKSTISPGSVVETVRHESQVTLRITSVIARPISGSHGRSRCDDDRASDHAERDETIDARMVAVCDQSGTGKALPGRKRTWAATSLPTKPITRPLRAPTGA